MHTDDLNKDEADFLTSWEEVHKKGILTFWVLFYVSKKRYDAGALYQQLAKDDSSLNEHSLYRLLRRLYDVGLVDQAYTEGRKKFYCISDKGRKILNAFMVRNIEPLSLTIRK